MGALLSCAGPGVEHLGAARTGPALTWTSWHQMRHSVRGPTASPPPATSGPTSRRSLGLCSPTACTPSWGSGGRMEPDPTSSSRLGLASSPVPLQLPCHPIQRCAHPFRRLLKKAYRKAALQFHPVSGRAVVRACRAPWQ